jgi:predicted DsbA family dithiol-disulfide isomerase
MSLVCSTLTLWLTTHVCRTYLSFKRLHAALSQLPASHPVRFQLRIAPYQLHPDLPADGTDKWKWYVGNRFGSDEKMRAYTAVMSSYGRAVGINFKFGGQIANSLDSLRAVCWVQDIRNGGDAEQAKRVLGNLYRQYFEEEKSPNDRETVLHALTDAGVPAAEAEEFLDDKSEYLAETKGQVREQELNGVDAVPFITIEGKKRDLHLEGAREVEQYVKALQTVTKESV